MKRISLLAALLLSVSVISTAQTTQDSCLRARIYNKEYGVMMHIDLYGQQVTVPGVDLFGALPGYLVKQGSTFYWLITDAKLKNGREATLQMINDYGSEDLTATLTMTDDSTYVLRQESGSSMKVPNKGKWQKLPKVMEFKRK